MSDNSKDGKVLYSGNEQLPNTSEADNPEGTASEEQNTEKPQDGPITRNEVMDLLKSQNVETYRQIQGLTDKLASNFDVKLSEKLSNLNENIELMKTAGVELGEVDIQKARQKVLDETLTESGQSTSDPNKPDALNQAGKQGESIDVGMMEQMIGKVDQKFGGPVMQEDPEAKLIKMDDPLTFIKTYEAAAEVKAKRLNTPVEARLSSMATGSNPSFDAETLAAKLVELQKDPVKNREERKKINKQLKELEGK